MPRHQYKKRPVSSDPVYNSYEVAKFINYLMKDGKREVAQKIVYETLEEIRTKGEDPLKVFHKAISNVGPAQEVRPRRLGGASYLVPTEVRRERKLYLALNWIIEAATTKSNKEFRSMKSKLLSELMDAAGNQGQAVSKRLQTEKTADANKAFAHLKW